MNFLINALMGAFPCDKVTKSCSATFCNYRLQFQKLQSSKVVYSLPQTACVFLTAVLFLLHSLQVGVCGYFLIHRLWAWEPENVPEIALLMAGLLGLQRLGPWDSSGSNVRELAWRALAKSQHGMQRRPMLAGWPSCHLPNDHWTTRSVIGAEAESCRIHLRETRC